MVRSVGRLLVVLVVAASGALACASGGRETAPTPPTTVPAERARAVTLVGALPRPATGPMAPAMATVSGEGKGHDLADVEGCASCHADVAGAWRKSAHAFASFNNPVYRVAVDKLRKDRGEKTSQFCGGCHDIALLVDGAMLAPVEPTDLRAHAGVACRTCHGIEGARPDGNASWDLRSAAIPIPKEGNDESLLRHRAAVGRPVLRTSAMCISCHKAFLDTETGNASHLTGQDDATPWSRSAFAGSHAERIDDVAEKDCRGCHMPRVPAVFGDSGAKNGTVASHLFLGGHTWLGAMQKDDALVEKAREFMKGRVSLDVAGLRHENGTIDVVDRAPVGVRAGERATIDVVMRNLDVGHRFPGGVMDAQDTWVEVVVEDAKGRRVAEAGVEHETTGTDPTAHKLASYMAKEDGSQLHVRETHEFRAGVYNHTISPRDAAVVGFAFDAPTETDRYPLRVTSRLRHRSRGLALQRAACADFKSDRGRAFGRVGFEKVARAIDACRPQPITDLATADVALGSADHPVIARPDEPRKASFARLHAYGLGLSHALQERLDDARKPLELALTIADDARQRGIVSGVLAQVAARQGRVEETFAWATRADQAAAEGGLPAPVAMQRARAEVLASTWRLEEAAPLFLDVAERTPRDDAAWAASAVALGAAGDAARALDVARRGLVGQPRDADMLRVQALSLTALHAEPAVREPADSAFLERRTPDDAPQIRGRCSAKVPGCANERIPVHVHAMRQNHAR